MSQKIRLDLHLLTQGLVSSREQAQRLIRAGKVRDIHGQVLDKPGELVPNELALNIKERPRFVSRGGEKLLGALNEFPVKLDSRVCLDGGISTGGFTDCLLQHGASRVYGIDVGYGQTAWTIRNDPRVVLRERTNLRMLRYETFYKPSDPIPTFAVADLSFISLKVVLPAIKSLIEPNSESILLVKPQFEVGRERVGKGGIVRDPKAHIDAISGVLKSAYLLGWHLNGIIASPIKGVGGNQEYLIWMTTNEPLLVIEFKDTVLRACS